MSVTRAIFLRLADQAVGQPFDWCLTFIGQMSRVVVEAPGSAQVWEQRRPATPLADIHLPVQARTRVHV